MLTYALIRTGRRQQVQLALLVQKYLIYSHKSTNTDAEMLAAILVTSEEYPKAIQIMGTHKMMEDLIDLVRPLHFRLLELLVQKYKY
jgi:hypothetical protein